MKITAAVARDAEGAYTIEELDLEAPRADEVLVEIKGAGFCHTDVVAKAGAFNMPYPLVVGHEGSGVVLGVGPKVTKVAPGDKVAVSFAYCGQCPNCLAHEPAYCYQFAPLNYAGSRIDGSHPLTADGEPVSGSFFGQSSLASHALTSENNVVKVETELPLEVLGPLGCGIQTGAGAIMNSLDTQPGSSVLIAGGGPVGLAAVMAAAARGAKTIILSEPFGERRTLAESLGATHTLDPTAGALPEQVRAIVESGVQYAFDTTGNPAVIEAIFGSVAYHATVGLVGVPADPAAALPLGLFQGLVLGVTVKNIIEGDADPEAFIPELLALHAEGRFPFEKLITTYPLSSINEALADQASGKAIKVVLTP
jgi:aryl-alcohol dehydrogenase